MKPIVFRIDPNVLSQFVKPSGQKKEAASQVNQVQDCLKQLNIDDDEEVEQFTNQQPSQPVIKTDQEHSIRMGRLCLRRYRRTPIMDLPWVGTKYLVPQCQPPSKCFNSKTKDAMNLNSKQPNSQIQLQNIPKDNRTTLMIKNIPNKYSQPLLLEEIDCTNKDTYNFFYLPIDFTNKCNVGYAFINFYDPLDIPKFYLEFHNRKWSKFNSEKICQITYARIQGVEELQGHFQYSTIMHEKDRRLKPIFKQSSEQKLKRK